ncbi:MAG: MliC family protein [Hyphomonadaceae bacterium]|nr:MliC family protein [Hyphomonadaceae bacterium]
MRALIMLASPLAALAACATPCPADIGQVYRQEAYRCVDGTELAVSFARQPNVAVIAVNAQRAVSLPAQPTAEGFRFSGAAGTFVGDGSVARWAAAGGAQTQCATEN